jgi:hypothetical protein
MRAADDRAVLDATGSYEGEGLVVLRGRPCLRDRDQVRADLIIRAVPANNTRPAPGAGQGTRRRRLIVSLRGDVTA